MIYSPSGESSGDLRIVFVLQGCALSWLIARVTDEFTEIAGEVADWRSLVRAFARSRGSI